MQTAESGTLDCTVLLQSGSFAVTVKCISLWGYDIPPNSSMIADFLILLP